MKRCDLHMHTTYSDGTMTPLELVKRAKQNNVQTIALTDHDTLAGLRECFSAGEELDINIIAGTELSVEYRNKTTHILGYFPSPEAPQLEKKLETLRRGRDNRNEKICQKLQKLGIEIELSEAEVLAEETVGRPHIAQVMMQKGYVTSVREAFDRFLKKGAPAYVVREKLSAKEAFFSIKEEGGVPVLAHPVFLGPLEEMNEILDELIPLGLEGMECIYSSYSNEETEFFCALAKKRNLLITGGSDFHGEVKPEIDLGIGKGSLLIPHELAEKLQERISISN